MPQRFFCGENTETHGIRLDVYLDEENGEIFDIEPDQNDGKEEIVITAPEESGFTMRRLTQANLTAGDTYGRLRNVIVIFITTYDPFGLNRMVYTIKNGCIEVPELEYEDGAQNDILVYKRKGRKPTRGIKTATALHGAFIHRECSI